MKNLQQKLGSIRVLLTLIITTISVFTAIFMGVSMYNRLIENTKESAKTNASQVVVQVAGMLNSYINSMVDISDRIIRDIDKFDDADQESASMIFNSVYKYRSDIAAIVLYDQEGEILAYAPTETPLKERLDIPRQDWFLNMGKQEGMYYFSSPHVQNLFIDQYKWVVTLSRYTNAGESGGIQRPVFAIDMNFSSMEDYCNNVTIGKRGYVFILDEDNNIIYHPQQQLVYAGIKTEALDFLAGKTEGSYLLSEKDEVISISPLERTRWKVVGVSFLEDSRAEVRQTMQSILYALLFALALLVVISIFVSKLIADPIVRLTRIMSAFNGKVIPVSDENYMIYEAQQLSKSFNRMIETIGRLLETIKAEEQELRKMELRALQAQINPHFLYNTLDSILWMCEQGDTQKSVKMISALACLFRISISRGQELISVADELSHAESYLMIQSMRYTDQFDYSIDVDPSVKECLCLKILLQPLIENSIYHGLNRLISKGKISIAAKDYGDRILLQVADNGQGIPKEDLAGIFEVESGNKYGIGIKNVNSRIQIYFGKEYGLQIESDLDVGTVSNIWIPKLKN